MPILHQLLAVTSCVCVIIASLASESHGKIARSSDGLLTSYDEMRMVAPRTAISDDITRTIFEQIAASQAVSSSSLDSDADDQSVASADAHLDAIKPLKSSFNKSAVVASDGVGVLKAAQKMLRIESDHDAHMEAKKHKDSLYSATIPDDYCWKPKSNPHCDEHYPYRSYDGSCNNLENYWWGAAGSSYKRLLPPLYDDGLNKMRQRSTVVRNARLPSARLISLAVHRERPTKSIWTNLMSTFSQLLSHDLSHFDLPANVTCDCHTDTDQDECYAVSLPRNDVHMRSHGLECIPFVRASARWSDKAECRLKPRTQWNDNSHFLDMDFVYANAANNPASRRFKRGLLATSRLANGELTFPRRKSSSSCPLNYDEPAYVTPDDDAEQNSYLFSAETLWLRNHNWLADGLARECSHWDDERLFQEARRINIAMYQHIVYDEYLPTLVGHKMAKKYDLLPLKRGYYTKYDRTLYPQISAEFAAAAFRLHTLVNHENCYADAKLQIVGCVDAQENTVTSRDSCESLDYVLRGLVARAGYEQTPQVNFALNNALLKQHDSLAVRDIQRGRDFGIPSYNEYRSLVGIKKATAFSEMKNIPKRVREQLERVYADVNDIDLWTGGMSEMALDDAVLGRTISTIIARQFRDLKKGDRFFYENGHKRATRFKLSQLDELRDTYMAYVICQNVKVEVIPKNPFVIADDELNPILRCQDLKQFNFKLWSKNSS